MFEILEAFRRRASRRAFRRHIEHSLALHRRGEVRTDGLQSVSVVNRLEIRWRARDVHPWDAADRADVKARKFDEQLYSDTEAAISRLFRALPHVDVIDVEVLDRDYDIPIMAGTVDRSDLKGCGPFGCVWRG
jgi:hypothetical protein